MKVGLATFAVVFSTLIVLSSASNDSIPPKEYHVPKFQVNELTLSNLLPLLTSTGLLAVSLDVGVLRKAALSGLCDCLDESTKGVSGTANGLWKSGVRRTLATATVGTTPLPLQVPTGCDVDTLEALRDRVAYVSNQFVQALDVPVFLESPRTNYTRISDVVRKSQHLEHFHLYESQSEAAQLDFHTDAGLFLAFVPGYDCQQGADASEFYLRHDGEVRKAIFPENSVILMLGAGAQHWLQSDVNFRATQHAVHMAPGRTRAWYGMMHLVPQDAIVQQSPRRSFSDMRQQLATYLDDVSIGCGNAEDPFGRPRRLGMVEDASACNNVTNFFCWMSCLDIPDADNAASRLADGESLYCLDPATLRNQDVSAAVDACTVQGVVGGGHDDACLGSWQPTAEGVHNQIVITDQAVIDSLPEVFCYGGTSMYMDGFHWTDTTCVIYLFESWTLSTAGSLVAACIGTLVFGMSLEGIIRMRRYAVQSQDIGWSRTITSTLLYGLQLGVGYLLMLVVMTYSAPLFLCTILGLMAGHLISNRPDLSSAASQKAEDKTEDGELVCCRNEDGDDEEELPPCCRPNEDKTGCVPEGATPCCQNAL